MISRTQIRQFLAVVDSGSFTRAAHALNIAQPSLSSGIAELERQLGAQVFVRERRRVRLTAAGNLLLPKARCIEREFHQVEMSVGTVPVTIRPIRLGILESISSAWLENILGHYAGSEPLELIEGSERYLASALRTGAADLALTLCRDEGAESRQEPLFREDYCLALPAKHPLANVKAVNAESVAGETMIARRACEILAETSRFFTERGVRPRFLMRSLNDDRVMAMVGAGLGITVAPRSLSREGVTMVRLLDLDLSRSIGVQYGEHWEAHYGFEHPLIEALRANP